MWITFNWGDHHKVLFWEDKHLMDYKEEKPGNEAIFVVDALDRLSTVK